jgi:hypothetical protein
MHAITMIVMTNTCTHELKEYMAAWLDKMHAESAQDVPMVNPGVRRAFVGGLGIKQQHHVALCHFAAFWVLAL